MGGIGFVDPSGGGPGKNYPGGMTWFVFVACFIASWGGLIFGYDIGISGGVTSMHPFLKKFFPSVYEKEIGVQSTNQYCKFNSEILTLFTSSLYLAALVSALFASTITRQYGRKISMLFGGLIFFIGASINGAAVNVSMLIIGRLLLGVGAGLSGQMLVGILIAIKFGSNGVATISSGYAAMVVVCICAYVAAFAWSWGPLASLVPSEIFPLEIRSVAQSINVALNLFFTFLIAQVFLQMLCHMKFGLFFFFAAWVAVMTVYIWAFLPETKGVPIEEMWGVWKRHKFWGKYIPDDVIPSKNVPKLNV